MSAIVAWRIAGSGMLMLASIFQTLSRRKLELDAGIYAYAKAGFGNHMGFTAASTNGFARCLAQGGMLLDRNAMAAEAGIMRPQRLHPAVQGGDRTCSPGGTVDHVAPASALSYPRS